MKIRTMTKKYYKPILEIVEKLKIHDEKRDGLQSLRKRKKYLSTYKYSEAL